MDEPAAGDGRGDRPADDRGGSTREVVAVKQDDSGCGPDPTVGRFAHRVARPATSPALTSGHSSAVTLK